MHKMTRRDFIRISSVVASSLLVSTGLSGCGNNDEESIAVAFDYGVASGDPLSDKVIIWTRVTAIDEVDFVKDISVNYEVSTDDTFDNIIHNGTYLTNNAKDFTVKIDVQELEENTKYYYRFNVADVFSESGMMKTLAVATPEEVKFAVFSCANYTNGYFNAYMEASKIENLDVSIHLGDYIYEYGMYENDDFEAKVPSYATSNATTIGREFPKYNNKECLTLEDYRRRYALYHTDKGLQALHKTCPMIVVWDDHEIANDTYENGAQNHTNDEGDFETRTTHALQAYFEWLPIRPVSNQKQINRTFDFGGLVSLHMLETRISGRDKQLNYADYYTPEFDGVTFTSDLTSPTRTMLGTEQLDWLKGKLQASTATWQVLGQQVLMGKMHLPAELLTLIAMLENPTAFGTTTEALIPQINTLLVELTTIKGRILQGDPSVSIEERDRVETVLPYNLDAWDGYFMERETILGTAKALGKNLVVLSGDTHNAWASNLKDFEGNQVGVEFATSSVSSPGLEAYLGLPDIPSSMQLEGALQLLVDDLHYVNTFDRGFMTVTFTNDEVTSNWHHLNNTDSDQYRFNVQRGKEIVIEKNTNPLQIS